ncbi:hypothetical protein N6H14_14175 [Paenibacillus sp. CC-CFT747]|nr:hypothetical protein N6H14_14175 [Paenibacillus sp. CC-CFT747]
MQPDKPFADIGQLAQHAAVFVIQGSGMCFQILKNFLKARTQSFLQGEKSQGDVSVMGHLRPVVSL